jgi:hypothetical protein
VGAFFHDGVGTLSNLPAKVISVNVRAVGC